MADTVKLESVTPSADGRRVDFKARDDKHVPFNKHSWQVHRCSAVLRVEDYDGSLRVNPEPWTAIELSEVETHESGRQTTRTISMTLNPEARAALVEMLSRDPQPVGEVSR